MDYKQALSEVLEALERGGDPAPAIARHERYRDELEQEVRLAGEARASAPSLPGPRDPENAWASLSAQLAAPAPPTGAQRGGSRRSFSRLASTPRLAFAGLALVLVAGLALGVVAGPLSPASTAEASIEGVVLENQDGLLTLQTATGIESLEVGAARVTGEDGANVVASELQPGQVVAAKARKQRNGTFAASQVQRKPEGALRDWCASHRLACLAVQGKLDNLLERCQTSPAPQCSQLEQRLEAAKAQADALRARIEELRAGCEQSQGVCRELLAFCAQREPLCKDFRRQVEQRLKQTPKP